jgi:nucleotide sugar dehydrogenase
VTLSSSAGRRVICVIGLGKIGLPVAVQCARHEEFQVIGCDQRVEVVDAVNRGEAPHVREPGLTEALGAVVRQGKLLASTDTAIAVSAASVALLIVPVGLTDGLEVDFTALDTATLDLGAGLRPGTLVLVEATVPLGTTRGRVARLLESTSGLVAGVDFSLAFSPERVYQGRVFEDLARYPKLVAGIDAESTRRATAFYASVLDAPVRALSSCEAAEYVKLAEATYRDVNIALANELALFAERQGLDLQEIRSAANSLPSVYLHEPGVGVGGPAIPIYPYFLFRDWDDFRLPPLARAINDGMAEHAVDLLEEELGSLDDQVVLLLGLSYRKNVRDITFSSARRLSRELRRHGAMVLGHDPLLDGPALQALKVQPADLDRLDHVDGVVIQAFHDAYTGLDLASLPGVRVVLDGRGALDDATIAALESRGIRYRRIGRAAHARVETG